MRNSSAFLLTAAAVAFSKVAFAGTMADLAVAVSDAEIEAEQARLSDRCVLTDFADRIRKTDAGEVWTEALQTALNRHEIVTIPASDKPYLIDAPVVIPSNRRIEAAGAVVRLAPGVTTVMMRTASALDGTVKPLPESGRVDNISVVGGRWEDNRTSRGGYGQSGRYNLSERKVGNFFGVSTLFYLGRANHVSVRDVTFARCGGFVIQAGDGRMHHYENIRFDDCYADGLHFNGNLENVHAKNICGKIGDDLVALNAYDWLDSSVNFGPQYNIVCENLHLDLKDGMGYPAIRIQPAQFRYEDGSIVDCAVSNVVFRHVRGIRTFKMYLQTPRYHIGTEPEWSAIGHGGNILFENIDVDLTEPIDLIGGYRTSDPLRGHYGVFEFGANLSSVDIRNVTVRFHLDKYPLGHLVVVGPKSSLVPSQEDEPPFEIFDPYVSSRVDRLTVEGLRVLGISPETLVYPVTFTDINHDGRSTGAGTIGECVIHSPRDGRTAVSVDGQAGKLS